MIEVPCFSTTEADAINTDKPRRAACDRTLMETVNTSMHLTDVNVLVARLHERNVVVRRYEMMIAKDKLRYVAMDYGNC